ncbi:MAG: LytTR family DNA-binding domain-containing protein [Balneolaceae bacterium]|nr:LytTR family DNA-binding domain-containing protein [Balneolaceae bacterium]
MKVFIVEDEKPARKKLVSLLRTLEPGVDIVGAAASVRQAIDWLRSNPSPDLAFFDIRLSDGPSFRIFDEYDLDIPVIFITAFDQYLLQAFRSTGIEYLLKPLKAADLKQALEKYRQLQSHFSPNITELIDQLEGNRKEQKRVVARKSGSLVPIAVDTVAYFTIRHGITFVITNAGDRYVIDESLKDLEQRLNPDRFYRANRQYLINARAIRKVNPYSNSRLLLELNPEPESPDKPIVSQEKTSEFKAWLSG